MQNQINVAPEAVITAQTEVIGDLQGKVIRLFAMVVTLTEEKRALEEKLARLEARGSADTDEE